jgi:hypothetical protein
MVDGRSPYQKNKGYDRPEGMRNFDLPANQTNEKNKEESIEMRWMKLSHPPRLGIS